VTRNEAGADRYRLKRILGEGGAGRVWLVEDRHRPGRDLALKELSEAGAPQHEDAFRREFATLACLHHPNLVEVDEFDTSPTSGLPRFTLEFIEGRDIVEAVRHEGPGVFMELTVEALRALTFLHEFDLIHRDLKPANLLVRDIPKLGCRLVIVDFGLALRAKDQPFEAFRVAGTLPYVAPELLANRAANRRSDLFALGAVLHQIVYGVTPTLATEHGTGDFIRELVEAPRTMAPLPAGYPAGLRDWLSELLSPAPERRPASAAEALVRLNESCGTRFPTETPASRTARLLSGPPAERESSLAQIRQALDPSAGPRVVWVCGSPGSGKSRILRWLEAEAILRGWQVASAFGPLRHRLADLREAARKQPTLVLLDEVHSAAFATLELLERVAREGDAPAVQVVAALRVDAIDHPALRSLFRATGTVPTLRRVDLGRLDAEGVRAMACRATGGIVSDERVEWLLSASEGSPALAESLLVKGVWERGGRVDAAAGRATVPLARLELISAPAKAWLECVAVLRKGVRDAHAAALTGFDPAASRAASDEASAAGLAYRKEGRWFVDSGALGEQLLAQMEPKRRCALHRAAAELLEARAGDDAEPSLIAALWIGAGELDRAMEATLSSAEARERALDPAGAASRYADALRLLRRSRAGRHALRRKQADALMRSGMYAAAARAAGGAVRLAPDELTRTDALSLRAFALVQAGRFQLALKVAEEAAKRALAAGNGACLAQARKTAGVGLGRLGRESEAIPVLDQARVLFREQGDVRGEADALHTLAACRARLRDPVAERDFVEAIELYRRSVAADGAQPPDGQDLKARVGLAVMRSRSGRYEDAAAILEEVRAAAVARGSLGIQEVALSKMVGNAIDLGKLDTAIALAEQAADLALHLGDHNLILVNRCGLSDARIRCGRAGEAVASLRDALDKPLAQVEPEIVDYARMLLADAWMESGGGDDQEIRTLLTQSLAGCRERGKRRAWLMGLVIEMERRARPDCGESFEQVRAEFDVVRGEREPVEPEIHIRACLASAAFRLTHGEGGRAAADATEAVTAARAAGYVAFEARAAAQLAGALERTGQEREADAAAEEGRRLLDRAAARIHDDAIRADFLERPVYAVLRVSGSAGARRSQTRLLTLYDMIRVLNSEPDADGLLDTILDLALRAVGAERGMIFLREDREGPGQGEFSVHLTRNLESETVKDAESFSRRIVEAAGSGRSLLALDAGSDERFRDLASVSLYQIRSLMCVPLRSRGRVIGTVYLDSRKDGRLFTQDDLRFVEAFADQAALAIENTRMRVRLERENRHLAAAAEARTSFANLVGKSPGIQAVFSLIEKVAATDLPVMIRGESGTGKELVARAIHVHGPRRRRPFLGENCAAIPETLLETELFGHVRGAFTGAERTRPGLFEQADGGTLFLDEVGDMSAAMQVRLLRVLEEGAIRKVGGEKPVPVNVRIITATHQDLQAQIKAGRFRLDLLYRLQVLSIEVPPLRERPGDVALLASHILERIAAERGRTPCGIDDDAMGLFERYGWPGNVRELQNTLQRLSLLAGNRAISVALIESDPVLRRTLIPAHEAAKVSFSFKAGEKEQLRLAIAAAGGNRRKAAGLLGVSRATLYRKLQQHGL
jgi:transcriptional regulator with GAF, ATPase, and Fis domain/tetratricopeptide (TPR) repeat protein